MVFCCERVPLVHLTIISIVSSNVFETAKVNMIAGWWNGDLHACVAGGCRNLKWRSPCASRWSPKAKVNMIAGRGNGDLHACVAGGRRNLKWRSPCASRWSPKAKVNMIVGRWSGDLHEVVGEVVYHCRIRRTEDQVLKITEVDTSPSLCWFDKDVC